MEDVKENSKEKPEYLEKERFTQKYDDIEKMKESRSIKEMTNEEFLSQFKNLPEIPEFKKLLMEYSPHQKKIWNKYHEKLQNFQYHLKQTKKET